MATSPSTRAAYHISTHLPRTRFFSHAITINVIKFGLATGTPTTIRYVKGETKATETENPKATTNSTLGLHFINFPGYLTILRNLDTFVELYRTLKCSEMLNCYSWMTSYANSTRDFPCEV